jgi:hypothetical protein
MDVEPQNHISKRYAVTVDPFGVGHFSSPGFGGRFFLSVFDTGDGFLLLPSACPKHFSKPTAWQGPHLIISSAAST